MSYLSAIELINASKEIGTIEPNVGKEFASFKFTIGGQKIAIKAVGVIGSEMKQSQFNSGKLQLTLDVSGDGVLLLAAEQLKKEIQQVLDYECLPEFEVAVTSWIKNKIIWVSWPKKGDKYLPVTINGKSVSLSTPEYDQFEGDLKKIGNVDDKVEIGFNLYSWIRYGKDSDGKSTGKVTVGFSPQLEYISYAK